MLSRSTYRKKIIYKAIAIEVGYEQTMFLKALILKLHHILHLFLLRICL